MSGWRHERDALVAVDLADTVICDRCGATLATYHTGPGGLCNVPISVLCPGYHAVEAAIQRANEKMKENAHG